MTLCTLNNVVKFLVFYVFSTRTFTQATDAASEPPVKKCKLVATSVFAFYAERDQPKSTTVTLETLIQSYMRFISNPRCTWEIVPKFEHYESVLPLLEYTFCAPAASAPVERIFSQGGTVCQAASCPTE